MVLWSSDRTSAPTLLISTLSCIKEFQVFSGLIIQSVISMNIIFLEETGNGNVHSINNCLIWWHRSGVNTGYILVVLCIEFWVALGQNVLLSSQHVAWQHQAITWTNVNLSSKLLWYSHKSSFLGNAHDINLSENLHNYIFRTTAISPRNNELTHWGRVTNICISKLTIIASDNGFFNGRRQAIIWTNDGKLIIEPLRTNFNEILIGMHAFSFKKMHLKMSSGKRCSFGLGLNLLNIGTCLCVTNH